MPDTPIECHPLDEATRLDPGPGGRLTGRTSPAYWNMTSPFGGVTAGLLMRAVLDHPERKGTPVSQTVNYCAPIAEGAFTVDVRVVRSGRSVQHFYVEIGQNGTVTTNATIICAARSQSWRHQPAAMPRVPPADALPAGPAAGPVAFIGRYDFRFLEGEPRFGPPLPEPRSPRSLFWIADRPARPLDFVSLAAFCDIFFPRVFQVRGYPVPAGTVSMTSYFHASEAELAVQADRPLLARADALRFGDQFCDQFGELWSDGGTLLASTSQIGWFRQ
jgi:acyl-CoA thioesterase